MYCFLKNQVKNGEALLATARHTVLFHQNFELLLPFHELQYVILSRKPRVIENYYSLLLPFPLNIWMLIITTLLIFVIIFYIIHAIYSRLLTSQKLHRKEDSSINFPLFVLFKFGEPDPIPWFTIKWSVGKLVTLQWSIFCLLIVLVYSCNLRAHLAAVKYEKSIDTVQDIIDNGKRPWLMTELLAYS